MEHPPVITGTSMLIDAGACPECFESKHLWWFAEAPINGEMRESVIYCLNPDFMRGGATAWVGNYIAPARLCKHGMDLTESPCQACDEEE